MLDCGSHLLGGRGVARIAHDGEMPRQVDEGGERLDQDVVAFARDQRADGQQRDRALMVPRHDGSRGRCPARATVMRSAGTP